MNLSGDPPTTFRSNSNIMESSTSSFIMWGDKNHPNFADGFSIGFGMPTMAGTYPEVDVLFGNVWLHLLLANGGYWLAALAVVIAYSGITFEDQTYRRVSYACNVAILLELTVEITMHVITGELPSVVDIMKLLGAIGLGMQCVPQILKRPDRTI